MNADYILRDEAELRSLFAPTHSIAVQKCQSILTRHAKDFILRAPFLCIGTQSASGEADVSPRGDPPGFVRVLDDRTLAIPDRPGNNRLDTFTNILDNPSVGLIFMIPGFEDTLRVNGRAVLSRDPDLLRSMECQGRLPGLAILVTVQEAFLHCAKAFRRSHLWSPEHRQDRKTMPSLIQMILDDTTGAPDAQEQKRLDQELEEDYKRTLY